MRGNKNSFSENNGKSEARCTDAKLVLKCGSFGMAKAKLTFAAFPAYQPFAPVCGEALIIFQKNPVVCTTKVRIAGCCIKLPHNFSFIKDKFQL